MKTLVLANQKGGVGKSAVSCQMAYYLAEKRNLRVLFIDLDSQGNSTDSLRTSKLATISNTTAFMTFQAPGSVVEAGNFVVVPGNRTLLKLESEKAMHNTFAGNFGAFLRSQAPRFDACIIDTAPGPDIRSTSALIAASHVVSPIQFNQQSIAGIGEFLRRVQDVQSNAVKLKANLRFIGLLPCLVEATPHQKENAATLFAGFPQYLIRLPDGSFAQIKRSSAMEKAMDDGLPLWKLATTTARDLWRTIEPTFHHIANQMEIEK